MYGLKQAAVLAYTSMVRTLVPHGYHNIPHTVGFLANKTHPTTFYLYIDDIGMKYFNNVDHEI